MEYQRRILSSFEQYFKNELLNYDCVLSSTPKTFHHYTSRHEGRVGGIPVNGIFNTLLMQKFKTKIPNYYLVGDTTFPGQSIVAQAQCAMFLIEEIVK